jgi:2'-5' RNA ligase
VARDRAARPEAKPLRLFVAVDIPDAIKETVAGGVEPFRDRIPGARWTNRSGWHITLKFLGSTWPRLVETVEEAVRSTALATPVFDSALTAIGAFPSATRARVLWVGLEDDRDRFGPIVRSLHLLLEDHFVPEKRGYTPHLTLARLQPPRNLAEFAPELSGFPMASSRFPIDRLVLYRSHLSPAGARYEPLMTAPFEGA